MSEQTGTLRGWNINTDGAADWMDWGDGGLARGKVLATGDDYMVVLVDARAGYRGAAHEHAHTEFSYVLDGQVRTQGELVQAGGAYVAAAGSQHTDFEAVTSARYLSIFKL